MSAYLNKENTQMLDGYRGFTEKQLPAEFKNSITEAARICRGNILKMTTLAMSGHPGGSMSSIEIYLMLYNLANVYASDISKDDRDRIIISHGHTSPGAYTALATAGFFDVDDAIAGFRLAGSPFEGHVERSVPGIEWGTGNLGQGLSVGIGKALYARLSKHNYQTYVFMGDGEQQKGQVGESRRIASKFKLSKLTAIIDYNKLQISGNIEDVLYQNIVKEWQADGWQVLEIDGHDIDQIYNAMYTANHNEDAPIMILARTVMGKGVSFMENKCGYHGAPVRPEQLTDALAELGIENDLDKYKQMRTLEFAEALSKKYKFKKQAYPQVNQGSFINYAADASSDNRSAFGKALESVAEANENKVHFGVFDCDLAGSVKTAGFEKKYPNNFFQFGITEHSTATTVGSLSAENAIGVWADFGMFAIAETYNQARLSSINHGNVKLFCTHCGINVGEDGMTHQSIDYFGLLNSTFGWKVITPADPNQTDKIVRYALATEGNFAVIMGRAVLPIITKEDGTSYFGEGYTYRYGRMEQIRKGESVALVASGNMLFSAMEAYELLKSDGKNISLYSISDWSDLHADDIASLATYKNVVILEDHNTKTGLGTAISDAMIQSGNSTSITKIGVTKYGSSGKPDDLYKLLGMDAQSVAMKIKELK